MKKIYQKPQFDQAQEVLDSTILGNSINLSGTTFNIEDVSGNDQWE